MKNFRKSTVAGVLTVLFITSCLEAAASVRISRRDPLMTFTACPACGQDSILDFDRIFSRIGTVRIVTSGPAGFTADSMSVTIKDACTAGTFNLRLCRWTDMSGKSDIGLSVGTNNVYVLPNTYTVSVTCSFTCGGQTRQVTKTASVTLSQGVNDITCFLTPDEDYEPVFTVSPGN